MARMSDRLKNLPVYSSGSTEIAAPRFNRARLAVLRLGAPLFLHIPELKHMVLIIEDDAWICADEVLNEFPILAWARFRTEGRADLHSPVRCRLLRYHEHADRIVPVVLNAMDRLLEARLRQK